MIITEILAYTGALAIGLTLGLTGAGGSILTLPILVYLLGINSIVSTGYSLFIVGCTAAVGAIRNIIKGFTKVKVAVWFGLPSMLSIFITRKFIITAIPTKIIGLGSLVLTKEIAVMLLFATLMIISGLKMVRRKKVVIETEAGEIKYPKLIVQGLFVGVLTGLVGAGGGFLIVPALVIMAKLPMKNAVGTSLLIIATNSMVGFMGDLSNRSMDWAFLLPFAGIAIVGIFMGMMLADRVNGAQLKRGFGFFVLAVAAFILFKEIGLMIG